MAYELPIPQLSLAAGESLTGGQYKAVKVDSSGNIVACGAGESGIGVLQDKPDTGQMGLVWMYGVTKAYCGGTVSKGDAVTPDASGKFVVAGGGDAIWGTAIQGGTSTTLATIALATRGSVSGTSRAGGSIVSIPINLATVANGDVVTNFTPGFVGSIAAVQFVVTTAVTTAAKAATLNVEINTTNVTGGVVSLTSANCTPLGATVAGTAVTANNTFDANDTISIEASSVTAFVEGAGVLLISLV